MILFVWDKGLRLVFSRFLLAVNPILNGASLRRAPLKLAQIFQVCGLQLISIFLNLRSASFSICTYDLMLSIICLTFDQDQFNGFDKPMLTIISTLVTQPVGAMLIFLNYQFKENLWLLISTHRCLVLRSIQEPTRIHIQKVSRTNAPEGWAILGGIY